MPEPDVTDRLEQILEAIAAVESYIQFIPTASDFYKGQGIMVFDAIVMRLQVLGENMQTLCEIQPEMFAGIENEVISIIRFRDIISRHYEKLDSEIIYEISAQYLPLLHEKIKAITNLDN